MVPDVRIRAVNDKPERSDGTYVLYWMIAARRTSWSFGLDRALERARHHGVPLLILEPLRAAYPWVSRRQHTFVVQGMCDQAARCAEAGVTYLPYVEPEHGEGRGLLEALASRAACVVTDTFPTFFLPRMVEAAGERLDVRLESVDGNGIVPLALPERDFTMAHSFRRWFQKAAAPLLHTWPAADPLGGYALGEAAIPEAVRERWPAADPEALLRDDFPGMELPEPGPVSYGGGESAAREQLEAFLDARLDRYADDRNDPSDGAASGLSPWLHYGHLGAHEVVRAVLDREGWTHDDLAPKANGKRHGWWGAGEPAEAFLDEIITWRELGYVTCFRDPEHHDDLESLQAWGRETLALHADDERPYVYDLEDFRHARTHDALWNAAQRQLLEEGRIHNYLRMLWGKKILHWTRSPEEALEVLTELNNRYAVDGRDPNSWSGILWTLGKFDRAWGPERPVFGKVRYMTSDSTRRKLDVDAYLARWGA